jgi:hypothetical protein
MATLSEGLPRPRFWQRHYPLLIDDPESDGTRACPAVNDHGGSVDVLGQR